jgi:hypothetical protein
MQLTGDAGRISDTLLQIPGAQDGTNMKDHWISVDAERSPATSLCDI